MRGKSRGVGCRVRGPAAAGTQPRGRIVLGRWVWPHGHVADEDIRLKHRDGSRVDEGEWSGQRLLVSSARHPAASFAFSNNTFVPSDVVVDIQGATVQVLVNVRDVASAAGPAREQAGQQAPQGQQLYYLAAAVLAGGGSLQHTFGRGTRTHRHQTPRQTQLRLPPSRSRPRRRRRLPTTLICRHRSLPPTPN